MATVLNVPPTEDFTAYTGLVSKQGDHLTPMVAWTTKECADVDGLDGLLSPGKSIVPKVADLFDGKLKQCQTGMGQIRSKVTTVDKELRSQDDTNATAISTLFGTSAGSAADISAIPGAALLGNFTDEDVTLKAPSKPDTISTGMIGGVKQALKGGSLIWVADKMYKYVTGSSFIDQLFKPLVGDWDRLMYLHDAYDTLGDACYTVAGTLRKGSWKIGAEWQGDTAEAFDTYMFRWTMGLGGIGDGTKEIAKVFKDVYVTITALVKMIVTKISAAFEGCIKDLAIEAAKTIGGDIAIEAIGLGPEDPLADVAAAAWTAYRMEKIYKKVKLVVAAVNEIFSLYGQIKTAVEKITSGLEAVESAFSSPMPSIGSLVDDVEQRGFDFEKNKSWDPAAGTARIAMLPSVS